MRLDALQRIVAGVLHLQLSCKFIRDSTDVNAEPTCKCSERERPAEGRAASAQRYAWQVLPAWMRPLPDAIRDRSRSQHTCGGTKQRGISVVPGKLTALVAMSVVLI